MKFHADSTFASSENTKESVANDVVMRSNTGYKPSGSGNAVNVALEQLYVVVV